jgi:TonB family protein
MNVIGLIGVILLALTLEGQSDQPVKLGAGGAAPVMISSDASQRIPCGSSSRSKENDFCGLKYVPRYPPEARKQHIQGAVHLRVVIGRDGLIKEVHVIDGDPMLTASAIESVKDWKYKPYRLKGKLVQIETVITVNYKIADSER